jgi:hypothetical protein
LLYCIYHYQLPLNQHDTDSLTYIRSVVETDRYRTEPFRCAHQYPRTVPIVYHVARLMGAFEIPELEPIRPKFIADIRQLLTLPQHPLDEILLHTSLLRLGQRVDSGVAEAEKIHLLLERVGESKPRGSSDNFYFFIAGLLTAYENPLLYRLARSPLFHIRWECDAHYWTLVAEYLALRHVFD